MKKILILIIVAIALPCVLNADLSESLSYAGDANTPAAFLYLPVGAKAIGLSQTYALLGTDPTAAFYNPATLVRIPWSGVSITGSTLSMDRYHTSFSMAFSASNTNRGERRVTAICGSFLLVDDLYSYNNNTGVPSGSLTSISGALGFSRAYEIAQKVNWGFSVFGLFDKQDDTLGYGLSLSGGAEMHILVLNFALGFRNLGFIHYSETFWLKPMLTGALSITLLEEDLNISLQYDYITGVKDSGTMRIGAEWRVIKKKEKTMTEAYNRFYGDKGKESRGIELRIRTGLANGALAGGLTLMLNRIEVTYAVSMADFEETGAAHTISLNYNF